MPRKTCPGCTIYKYKHEYGTSAWGKKDKRGNCFLCIDQRIADGLPFECNTCFKWKAKEVFLKHQLLAQSQHTRVCDECLERRECIVCKEINSEQLLHQANGKKSGKRDKTTTDRGKCRECMSRAEIGIWICNGCNQHLFRDATFSKWLQGRKSDHKKPSARCHTCYDKDEKAKKRYGTRNNQYGRAIANNQYGRTNTKPKHLSVYRRRQGK